MGASGKPAACKKCKCSIAHDEPRLRMYQRLGYGHGFAVNYWHVDCPDSLMLARVKASRETVYQQVMAATESASVTARRQREHEAQQRATARQARRQPSVRDLFRAAGGGH